MPLQSRHQLKYDVMNAASCPKCGRRIVGLTTCIHCGSLIVHALQARIMASPLLTKEKRLKQIRVHQDIALVAVLAAAGACVYRLNDAGEIGDMGLFLMGALAYLGVTLLVRLWYRGDFIFVGLGYLVVMFVAGLWHSGYIHLG